MTKPDDSRRSFLKKATATLGAAMGAALAIPVVKYLFYPVGKKVVRSGEGMLDVIADAEIKAGAPPIQVPLIVKNQRDAFVSSASQVVGSAWISRDEKGNLQAFSAVCPHLGCAINLDTKSSCFRCPCHKSEFALDGNKNHGPSKRGLDPLPLEVKDGRILLRRVQYRLDVSEREEV